MSEYTNATYDLEPAVKVGELLRYAGLPAVGHVTTAARTAAVSIRTLLRRYRDQVAQFQAAPLPTGATETDRLTMRSRLEALAAVPILASAVQAEAPDLFAARDALPSSADAAPVFPEGTLRELDRAIGRGVQRLMVAEATLMHDKVHASLTALGYTPTRPRRPQEGVVTLQGVKRGGPRVSIEFTPVTGRMLFDMSSFEGMGCAHERARLFRELKRRGVPLTIIATDRHGRREGSVLTAKVNARLSGETEAPGETSPPQGLRQR